MPVGKARSVSGTRGSTCALAVRIAARNASPVVPRGIRTSMEWSGLTRIGSSPLQIHIGFVSSHAKQLEHRKRSSGKGCAGGARTRNFALLSLRLPCPGPHMPTLTCTSALAGLGTSLLLPPAARPIGPGPGACAQRVGRPRRRTGRRLGGRARDFVGSSAARAHCGSASAVAGCALRRPRSSRGSPRRIQAGPARPSGMSGRYWGR